MSRYIFAALLWAALAAPAMAVNPSEVLPDPAQETRAREISKGLRCVVCQNQSIDDSDATLARDLRLLVRERISAGDTDKQVLDYVVSRYGDFVLLKPPFKIGTLALWLGPLLIVVLALLGGFAFFRRQGTAQRRGAASAGAIELSDADRKRLDALLKDGKS